MEKASPEDRRYRVKQKLSWKHLCVGNRVFPSTHIHSMSEGSLMVWNIKISNKKSMENLVLG